MMRLLIVNDAVLASESMKNEIDWPKYGIDEVITAYNVTQAQQAITENSIQIILCDIEMPGQNGLALIRWIREQHLDIECILLTCHADFSYAQEAVGLGCQDYLLLPASYEDVAAVVNKVVLRCKEKVEHLKLEEYGRSWLFQQEKNVVPETMPVRSPKESVEEAITYIMQNLNNETLSVNETAAHCYLNPIYLNRIFKKEKKSPLINLL